MTHTRATDKDVVRSHLSHYGMTVLATTVGLAATGWGILIANDRVVDSLRGYGGPPPVEHLWPAVAWALQAITLTSAVWVVSVFGARRGRPWIGAIGASVGLAVWTAAAFPRADDHVVLPWPGPLRPVVPGDLDIWTPPVYPALSFPLALLLLVVVVAWMAARAPGAEAPDEQHVASRPATGIAIALLGAPSIIVLAGALVAHSSVFSRIRHTRLVDLLGWDEVVLPPVAAILLVIVAGVVSGERTSTVLPLVVAWAATFVPVLSRWLKGGADGLLISAFAVLAAMALAWGWRPVALHLQDALAEQRPTAG